MGWLGISKGAGKKQKKDCSDPCLNDRKCQVMACDIQYCLSRNNYQQAKCQHFVEKWNACCERAKKQALEKEQLS